MARHANDHYAVARLTKNGFVDGVYCLHCNQKFHAKQGAFTPACRCAVVDEMPAPIFPDFLGAIPGVIQDGSYTT